VTAVDSMEIESSKLTTCDVAPDGDVITLNLVDAGGNPVSLRLPFDQAGALAMTLPGLLSKALGSRCGNESLRYVFPLGEWLLEGGADGCTVIVTLKTVDGFEVSFGASADMWRSLAAELRESAVVPAAAPARTN
jgi:hypothetical protein